MGVWILTVHTLTTRQTSMMDPVGCQEQTITLEDFSKRVKHAMDQSTEQIRRLASSTVQKGLKKQLCISTVRHAVIRNVMDLGSGEDVGVYVQLKVLQVPGVTQKPRAQKMAGHLEGSLGHIMTTLRQASRHVQCTMYRILSTHSASALPLSMI